MNTTLGAVIVMAALALAGCGNCPASAIPFGEGENNICGWDGDDYLYGADVHDETSADNTVSKDPEFRARMRATIEAAADFWEVSPWAIKGWRVRLLDVPLQEGYRDVNRWTDMTITLHVGYSQCVETGNLIHEFGHLPAIYHTDGDPNHSRPRWTDFSRMKRILQEHFPRPIFSYGGADYPCLYDATNSGEYI